MSDLGFPWREMKTLNPFFVTRLPLIARLRQLGFHKFKRKWTKRILKRPCRWVFDVAYRVLRLKGTGEIEFRREDEIVVLRFNGRSLHFSSLYSFERTQIFEPQVMGLLELLIREDEAFFDVGANWGMESLHAAVLANWRGPIHAFEPVQGTFDDLQSLISQAGLEGRITAHNLALSHTSGTNPMAVSEFNSGSSKLIYAPTPVSQSVQTMRLDDLTLPDPTFIKLDVEGHEAQVCQGARETIARVRPFIIFETWSTETNYMDSESIFRSLGELGYVFFRPAWQRNSGGEGSVWPLTQPPSTERPRLTLIPMSPKLRPFMDEHIDIFACHEERLCELHQRFSGSDGRK